MVKSPRTKICITLSVPSKMWRSFQLAYQTFSCLTRSFDAAHQHVKGSVCYLCSGNAVSFLIDL